MFSWCLFSCLFFLWFVLGLFHSFITNTNAHLLCTYCQYHFHPSFILFKVKIGIDWCHLRNSLGSHSLMCLELPSVPVNQTELNRIFSLSSDQVLRWTHRPQEGVDISIVCQIQKNMSRISWFSSHSKNKTKKAWQREKAGGERWEKRRWATGDVGIPVPLRCVQTVPASHS